MTPEPSVITNRRGARFAVKRLFEFCGKLVGVLCFSGSILSLNDAVFYRFQLTVNRRRTLLDDTQL